MDLKNIIQELEDRKNAIYKIDCDTYKGKDYGPYITGCGYCKASHDVSECPKSYADNLRSAIKVLKKDFKVAKLIIKKENNLEELRRITNE